MAPTDPGSAPAVSVAVATTVRILVPASTTTQAVRPKYVSISTQGLAVTVWPTGTTQPAAPQLVANLTPASSACAAITGGARACTFTVASPAGTDNFLVTTYDQAPSADLPQGNVLSTTTVQDMVVQNATNALQLTLNGQPATIVVSPLGVAVPPGIAASFTMTVLALDADGNYIVGSGKYANPVTLAVTNDPNQTLLLSTFSIASPATSSVTVSWSGNVLTGFAKINASSPGAASGVVVVEAINGIVVPSVVPTPNPIL